MLASFVVSAVALGALGLPFVGVTPYVEYLELAPKLAMLDQQAGYPLHLQHNLLGIGRRWLGLGGAADIFGWALAGVILTLTLLRLRVLPRLQGFALCLLVASLLNPHVHHYDLLPPILALAILLGGGDSLLPFGLLLFNHLAFPMMAFFELDDWLPLPTFAVLAIWLCFMASPSRAWQSPWRQGADA
jgi:hypothetical protein